jgi:hypothetical protein
LPSKRSIHTFSTDLNEQTFKHVRLIYRDNRPSYSYPPPPPNSNNQGSAVGVSQRWCCCCVSARVVLLQPPQHQTMIYFLVQVQHNGRGRVGDVAILECVLRRTLQTESSNRDTEYKPIILHSFITLTSAVFLRLCKRKARSIL